MDKWLMPWTKMRHCHHHSTNRRINCSFQSHYCANTSVRRGTHQLYHPGCHPSRPDNQSPWTGTVQFGTPWTQAYLGKAERASLLSWVWSWHRKICLRMPPLSTAKPATSQLKSTTRHNYRQGPIWRAGMGHHGHARNQKVSLGADDPPPPEPRM